MQISDPKNSKAINLAQILSDDHLVYATPSVTNV